MKYRRRHEICFARIQAWVNGGALWRRRANWRLRRNHVTSVAGGGGQMI
jgi:hypothetical protein